MDYILPLILGSLIGVVVLYYVVHAAVLSALRAHSVWERDGGLDQALKDRARQQAENAPKSAAPQAE